MITNNYLFVFAGQSNAQRHFTGSGETGAQKFSATISALTGENSSLPVLNTAVGGSAAAREAQDLLNEQNYWWDLANDQPGPRLTAAVDAIEASNRAPTAIIWAQGEQDSQSIAGNTENQISLGDYREATVSIFEHFRTALSDPDLPIFIQQLATTTNADAVPKFADVRFAQAEIAKSTPGVFLSAVTYDVPLIDSFHHSTEGYRTIGERLAHAVTDTLEPQTPGSFVSPRIVAAETQANNTEIVVRIAHGGGNNFTPQANIEGFSVRDAGGLKNPTSVTRLDGDEILLRFGETLSGPIKLSYIDKANGFSPANVVKDTSPLKLPLTPVKDFSVTVSAPPPPPPPSNQDPIANNDPNSTTQEDGAVTIAVLVNDSDPDGDPLTVTGTNTAGTAGSVQINANGSVTYTPGQAFQSLGDGEIATDSFGYTIADGEGGSDSATVTVTILGRNDAPTAGNNTASTGQSDPIDINVLGNDSDPENDTLTVTALNTSGTLGTAQINPDNSITYDPGSAFIGLRTGQSTTDRFQYQVSDGQGGSNTATVTVTVRGRNDSPLAVDDSASGSSDAGFTIPVLTNDRDPDGDPLTVTGLDTSTTQGAVTISANGSLSYDPTTAFAGLAPGQTATDRLGYTVSDGQGGSGQAEVTITVVGAESSVPQPDPLLIIGTAESEILDGSPDRDSVIASDGDDTITGGSGNDSIFGDGGNDEIRGNQDADVIFGGDGFDTLRGSRGDDWLQGNKNGDTLNGGTGNDEVRGGNGFDNIRGARQNDTLVGGKGADTLNGGVGNDLLTGGENSDVFVFDQSGGTIGSFIDPGSQISGGSGFDMIADFTVGEDLIRVTSSVNGLNLNGSQDLLARLSTDGQGGSLLDLGPGNQVIIAGVTPSDLSAASFLLE